jgi:hypothetical protein
LKPTVAAQLQEPFELTRTPNIEDTEPELPPQVSGELPGTPTEPSVTNKIPSAAKDPDNFISGAVFIVMIVSLFSFLLVISLKDGFRRKR